MIPEAILALSALAMLCLGLSLRRVPPTLTLLAVLALILTITPVRAHDGPEAILGPRAVSAANAELPTARSAPKRGYTIVPVCTSDTYAGRGGGAWPAYLLAPRLVPAPEGSYEPVVFIVRTCQGA